MQSTFYQKIVIILLAATALTSMTVYGLDYTTATLTLDIFPDGSAAVEYRIEPDPSLASVNVTLLGQDYVDLLATDQDGIILDWSPIPGGVEVDSLGSDKITISYSTQSLTNKTGSMWSLTLDAPVNPIVTLPAGAVLVGLSPPPIDISIIENRAIMTMPAGVSRVSYLIGTTGTREHALVLLSGAEKAVNAAKLLGLVVDDAEAALAQARSAYDAGLYSQSEQISTQASRLAQETVAAADEAEAAIQDANTLLQSKQGKIRQETLEAASSLIDAAEDSYAAGDYSSALSDAEQAHKVLTEAEPIQSGLQMLLMAGAALVVLVAAGYAYIRRRGKTELPAKPEESPVNVNLDAVFRERPHLRTDDKAVLLFIQGKGGAFITEVRDHFNIPKSSAWRMARRLEDEGLLSVSTVGRETYLQLREPEGSR